MRKIEYEGLYLVCFKCGTYGHMEEACNVGKESERGGIAENLVDRPEESESFIPWMLAVRKNKRNNRN